MRWRVLAASLLCLWSAADPALAAQRQAGRGATATASAGYDDLGPEMTAYMGFIDDEQAELEHLYKTGEVSASDYRKTRARLEATRLAALRVSRARGDDVVPDLYLLQADELTQVHPKGIDALRGKRPGDPIDDVWLYHGTIRRGALFYVIERTRGIGRSRPF